MSEPERINLMELCARERLGMPDDWTAYYFAWMPPDGDPLYLEVRGAVVPLVTRGPRKGQINFRKRDASTERAAYIPVFEWDRWLAGWEARTGYCHRCTGTGQTTASWSAAEGTTYRDCAACQGTGKAKEGEN